MEPGLAFAYGARSADGPADGQHVRASADENAELFWGMRGAGANFGIATGKEYVFDAEKWAAKLETPTYAMDDDTAIVWVDGEAEVVSGTGNWKLLNA